jgi:hypothetical protein
MEGFVSEEEAVLNKPIDYRQVNDLSNGEWALSGKWIISKQYVTPMSDGILELGFHASNVFLVIEAEESGGRIEVKVDGQVPDDTEDVKDGVLSPNGSRLYQLVGLEKPGKHVLNLNVKGKLRLFAFTFG